MHAEEKHIDEAREFVNDELMGALSTIGPSGAPESSAVYYFVDLRNQLYFVTQKRSRKYTNMQRDPRVSFTVFSESLRKTVQMQGIANQVVEEVEQADFLELLQQRPRVESSYRNAHLLKGYFNKLTKEEPAIFKVKLEWSRFGKVDDDHIMQYYQLLPNGVVADQSDDV